MRIVLTVHQFLPDFSAGTELIALGIARELRRRGHAVTVVTGFPDPRLLADDARFDRYAYDGIPVERFRHAVAPMGDQRVLAELAYDNRLFGAAFARLLDRLAPDVVHFVHLGRLSASLVAPCVARGIATVFTATDFWAACPYAQLRLPDGSPCAGPDASAINCVRHVAGNPAARARFGGDVVAHVPDWLIAAGIRAAALPFAPPAAREARALARRPAFVRDRLNRVDRVLAPSRTVERALVASGIAPGRIRVLPYGIETGRFTRDTARGTGPTVRFGFVGSVVEPKGVHVALRAMARLDGALPVTLDVHGPADEAPAGAAYHRAVAALAAADPRVRLCGPFPADRAAAVLASLDALVVPSLWRENTPLVVQEAFAAGCPVIASDVAGIAELVRHEVDGLLFAPGDDAALAACLARVATDRALLARLAEASRPPLSLAAHVTALEATYAEILAEHGARPPNDARAVPG